MIHGVRKPKTKADSASIAFEAFGVCMEVTVEPEKELHRVRALLPPGWKPSDSSRARKRFAVRPDDAGTYSLLRDEATFADYLHLELVFALLEAQVRAYVALHAPDRIFVHAGVVGHHGRAIVIPGMSFSGKTTLVAALVAAGATYLSDEFAPLDAAGLVHPYPKPLSVRDEHLIQRDHDVAGMGGVVGDEPLPIGLVVATSYTPGARWNPRRLSPGEGVLALLSHTVAAQTRPAEAMPFLRRSVEGAIILESPRDSADAIAGLLLSELEP